MKKITAFIHHVRSADVIEALRDAGYKNISLLDIKGTLKPLGEQELAYSSEAGVVISEVQLSLVCEDNQVDEVTATMRNIRQNLFFAFVYNAAGVPIAAGILFPVFGILLSPIIAAAAMSLSSVSVIANALRLKILHV
ncbi:MAG: P-II family nitrogen regulator [Rickettsiales bacterium]|jgi:nitrogen regulatory protein P-II 1